MAHEYEQGIKCPYCDYTKSDSWEYIDDAEGEIDCDCGKSYTFSVLQEVTYSTYKKDCEDDKHDYGEPDSYRHKDNTRKVECKNCDNVNYIHDSGKLLYSF